MSQSARKYRPRIFKEVVGQKKVLDRLTKLWKSGDFPNAFLFHGPSGVGKTTVAKIVALSVQCNHSKFGKPCRVCRRKKKNFPIYEINASEATGIQEAKQFAGGSSFGTLYGKYKVYILDEAHMMSKSAQNLLLKYFEPEDEDEEVIWFICTTHADAIIPTLRQRCRVCRFSAFSLDDVKTLVERLLVKKESELSPDALVEEIYENRITSGRLIANAVDNYVAGESPEDAVGVELESEFKIKHLGASLRKGEWDSAQKLLQKIPDSQVRSAKLALLSYFREVLINGSDISARTKDISKVIHKLAVPYATDNLTQSAAFAATCYQLCEIFKQRSM